MTIFQALLLGLVQGATEFLPVSSSGHLLLLGQILGVGEVSVGFELVCHLGTLAAILPVMRKDVLVLLKRPLSSDGRLILLSTAATVAVVLPLQSFFRQTFSSEYLMYTFLITAILLLATGLKKPSPCLKKMTRTDALAIGVVQGIAALPGISRSGSTIAAGTLLGYTREQSARFSFLISIPVIIGSSVYELARNGVDGNVSLAVLLTGCAAAFASGLIGISVMLKLLKKYNPDGFALYLFALSVFLLVNRYALHLF